VAVEAYDSRKQPEFTIHTDPALAGTGRGDIIKAGVASESELDQGVFGESGQLLQFEIEKTDRSSSGKADGKISARGSEKKSEDSKKGSSKIFDNAAGKKSTSGSKPEIESMKQTHSNMGGDQDGMEQVLEDIHNEDILETQPNQNEEQDAHGRTGSRQAFSETGPDGIRRRWSA
jgi:hypothetical protein